MTNRSGRMSALALSAAAAVVLAGTAAAQQKEVIIGMQCDRTGATQITGVVLCLVDRAFADSSEMRTTVGADAVLTGNAGLHENKSA